MRTWRAMGAVYMAGAALLWSAMEAIVATLGQYGTPQVVWTRYSVHLLLLVGVLWGRGQRDFWRTRRLPLHGLRGSMMLVMPLTAVLARRFLPVPNLLSLFWLSPLLVALLSYAFLREKIAGHAWVVVVGGYVGMLLLFMPNGRFPLAGLFLALCMTASFSLYLFWTVILSRTESIPTNLFYTALTVWLLLTLALPWYWQTPTVTAVARMALVGVLGLGTLWLLEKAVEETSLAQVAPFLYLQPVWNVLLAAAWRGRWPDAWGGVGLALVLALLWWGYRTQVGDAH